MILPVAFWRASVFSRWLRSMASSSGSTSERKGAAFIVLRGPGLEAHFAGLEIDLLPLKGQHLAPRRHPVR